MDNISTAGKMMEKSAPSVKAQMVKGLALPSVKVPAAVLVAFSNRCGKFHRLLPVSSPRGTPSRYFVPSVCFVSHWAHLVTKCSCFPQPIWDAYATETANVSS